MTLTHILVFAAAALPYYALPRRARRWALLIGSVLAIYWLQPAITVRRLDFLFPTATLALAVLAWLVSRAPGQGWTREDGVTAGILLGVVLLLPFGRFFASSVRITPNTPPAPINVAIGALVVVALLAVASRVTNRRRLIAPTMGLILVLFAILKSEPAAHAAAGWLRGWQGQDVTLARAAELDWLGFSYVAFRLIHTLRDRQMDRLPPLTLREYLTYAIFFPAYTAGPIDRAERFQPDLAALPGPAPDQVVQGGMRIAVGIAKKFVIADSLALFALSADKAPQAESAGALWVMLYAYTFLIYFDFSGYTDIAIGIGQLYGVKLPENFNLPYLKRNITLFWQSWHITLSQWVRFYVFSPLSRFLLSRKRKPSPTALAFIGQMATMLAIGLWHAVAWPFVIWGAWHAIGLFAHKVYSDRTRMQYIRLRTRPRTLQAIGVLGVLLTFHFVALGWVWFALPDVRLAWEVMRGLFGIR